MMTQSNTGHGHVMPRADGVKMRCGGPGICSVCQKEQRDLDAAIATPPAAQVQGEREGFEAYAKSKGWDDQHLKRAAENPERYDDWGVQPEWLAFKAGAAWRAALSAPPAAGVLEQMSEEARSTLVGMVEFCLERRYRMGMDEGFASFDPEVEHDFVKELRAFVEGAPTPPASEQQQAVVVPELEQLYSMLGASGQADAAAKIGYLIGLEMSRKPLTEAQMHRLYVNSSAEENEGLSFLAFARLMRRAEAVHQIERLNPHLAGVNQGVTTGAGNGGDA